MTANRHTEGMENELDDLSAEARMPRDPVELREMIIAEGCEFMEADE